MIKIYPFFQSILSFIFLIYLKLTMTNKKSGSTKKKEQEETKITRAKPNKKVILSESESEEEEEEDMNHVMKSLFADFKKEIKKELKEFEKSMNYNGNKLDDVLKKLSEMECDMKKINEKQEMLEAENDNLKMKIKILENSMDEMEQYSRNKNIQVDGIPVQKDENLKEMLMEIGKKIDVNMKKEDIDAIHRVPTRSTKNPEPIIVQFLTRQMKEELITKSRGSNLCTEDIGINCSKSSIYINDHLSKMKKQLMFEARQLKKSKNYKFIWSRNGKIFVRKHETSNIIHINSMDDLQKIV